MGYMGTPSMRDGPHEKQVDFLSGDLLDAVYNMKEGIQLHGKGNSKLPWRKAGQPRNLVDVVDLDQQFVNQELSLCQSQHLTSLLLRR